MEAPEQRDTEYRRERDDEERWEAANRRHHFLAGAWILLAAAIAVLAWYAYPILKQRDSALKDMPVLTQAMGSLRDRMQQAEQKAADSTAAQRSAFRDEAGRLARDLRAQVDAASKRASQSAEQAYNRIEAKLNAEIENRTEGVADLKDRMQTLEASRRADQTQIAELQQEFSQLRDQQAELSNQLAQIRGQAEQHSSGANQQFSALQQEDVRSRRDFQSLSDRMAVEKLPFEAARNRDEEVAPGISLHVSSANSSRGVSGWLQIENENRRLWLRNQGAQEPVVFYDRDGAKRELVFTDVAKNSAAGYLLIPKPAAPANEKNTAGE